MVVAVVSLPNVEAALVGLCGHVGVVDLGDGRGWRPLVQVLDKVVELVLAALGLALDLKGVSVGRVSMAAARREEGVRFRRMHW